MHPSVIYGFYLHDLKEAEKKKLYPKYRHHLISSDTAIRAVKTNAWTAEDPVTEIEKIIEKISS